MTQCFALELDSLHAQNGWMSCHLVVNGQRHHLDATSVFPPFEDLLAFARAVAFNALPHEFFWEEEGHGAKFQALPLTPDDPGFRLRIDHDGEIVVNAEFDRKQIALDLLEALRGMALDCPGAESEWEFPYFLIENFERDLVRGFASGRSQDPQAICAAHFVFGHYGGYGGQTYPAFTIWVDERQVLYMAMDDIPRFWQMWFELLEKIGSEDFPAEAVFHKDEEERPDLFTSLGMDAAFRFRAEALPDPRYFQLKIVTLISLTGEEQAALDAPFERRQFARSFVTAFSEFLRTGYAAFLESKENEFDLRTLPLDRLTAL
ncbi:MAG: hypothetical protein ACM33V_10040 [Chloroflexota bacterium]